MNPMDHSPETLQWADTASGSQSDSEPRGLIVPGTVSSFLGAMYGSRMAVAQFPHGVRNGSDDLII